MQAAYIVKAYRTAVGKAPKGVFRFKRPDELAGETIDYLLNQVPQLDRTRIDDVIVGNAMPEAEQGLKNNKKQTPLKPPARTRDEQRKTTKTKNTS
jgi:acetyl-CoA acetyltransferase